MTKTSRLLDYTFFGLITDRFIANFFPLVAVIPFLFIDQIDTKTSRMLASPFLQLIVKFVSRQVEKLPSLKSKSYSFRGAKPNLFGSIYRTNSHPEACSTHSRNSTFRCFNLCSREFLPRSTVYLKTSLVSFDPCCWDKVLLRSPFLGSINSREACSRVRVTNKNSYIRIFFFFLRENLDPFHVSILHGRKRGGIERGEFWCR